MPQALVRPLRPPQLTTQTGASSVKRSTDLKVICDWRHHCPCALMQNFGGFSFQSVARIIYASSFSLSKATRGMFSLPSAAPGTMSHEAAVAAPGSLAAAHHHALCHSHRGGSRCSASAPTKTPHCHICANFSSFLGTSILAAHLLNYLYF